jgi:hypothetical protein
MTGRSLLEVSFSTACQDLTLLFLFQDLTLLFLCPQYALRLLHISERGEYIGVVAAALDKLLEDSPLKVTPPASPPPLKIRGG